MIIALSLVIIAGFMMPMHYSSSSYRASNIITGTNNTYPIYLSGVPKGNGTYQQLITINNYSKYGINDNGSNIEFFDSLNYTHLYAWIQFINTTSMQVWIKNYNQSMIIYMQVFSRFENMFSANGYLGKDETSTDNGALVFPYFAGNLSSMAQNSNLYYIDKPAPHTPFTVIFYGQSQSSSSGVDGYDFPIFTDINLSSWIGIGTGVGINYFGLKDSSGGYVNLYPYNSKNNTFVLSMINSTYVSAYVNNGKVYTENVSSTFAEANYIGLFEAPATFGALFITTYIGLMPVYLIVSLYHSIDFKLIGSTTSINWGIFINGTFYNANSSNIYLNMTNGYYNIIVNLPAGYSPIANNVLKVDNTNQIFKIVVVSQNNNSNFSNEIMYAIILASIIIAVALYFSRRN